MPRSDAAERASAAELPIIRHSFGPSRWKPAYSITWDWERRRWLEALEPERGEMTLREELRRGAYCPRWRGGELIDQRHCALDYRGEGDAAQALDIWGEGV